MPGARPYDELARLVAIRVGDRQWLETLREDHDLSRTQIGYAVMLARSQVEHANLEDAQRTLAHRPTKRLTSFSGHPMIEHFKFLKANTKQTPKMTIPAPSAPEIAMASRIEGNA